MHDVADERKGIQRSVPRYSEESEAPGVTHSQFEGAGVATIPNQPLQRKYLPTLADLIDRLTIVQQKQIFIPDKREEYAQELEDLMHDIDLIITRDKHAIDANAIHAICVIMLANRYIWENESIIRDGTSREDAATQLKRLKATHSINGVRNTAKNVLSELTGGRKDYKIDAFAADLPPEMFGNWDIFGGSKRDKTSVSDAQE